MVKHLKPLFVKDSIIDKMFSQVFVDEEVVLNVMLLTIKKLGKNIEDLIPTNMKMTNFMGITLNSLGVLISSVMIGSNEVRLNFFVIDGKPTYSAILDR